MGAHLLTIGINYEGDWGELRGCVPDAKLLAARWGPYCDSVEVLLENKADREGILKAGCKVLSRCEPGDLFVITQSSHGTRERHQGRYVEGLVARDLEIVWDYEMDDLLGERAPGVLVFAAVDACHSGTIHRGNHAVARTLPVSRCRRHSHAKDTTPRAITNAWGFHGCDAGDYSYDGEFFGRPNGAMTFYMEAARTLLRPGASYVDWFRLFAGSRGVLPSEEYPQTPALVGSRRNVSRAVPFVG